MVPQMAQDSGSPASDAWIRRVARILHLHEKIGQHGEARLPGRASRSARSWATPIHGRRIDSANLPSGTCHLSSEPCAPWDVVLTHGEKGAEIMKTGGSAGVAERGKKPAAIRDVAQVAGCGIASASRALNQNGFVSRSCAQRFTLLPTSSASSPATLVVHCAAGTPEPAPYGARPLRQDADRYRLRIAWW